MADDNAPTKNQAPPRPPAGMEPIKVRQLTMHADCPTAPGAAGDSSVIMAGPRRRTGSWIEIQYEPWQRHHRVREYETGPGDRPGKLKEEYCIHESWALYVPA